MASIFSVWSSEQFFTAFLSPPTPVGASKCKARSFTLHATDGNDADQTDEDFDMKEQDDLAMKVATFRLGVIAGFVTGTRLG